MPINRENMQKVRDLIAALPRRKFCMSHWAASKQPHGVFAPVEFTKSGSPKCNTVACIGGWTQLAIDGSGQCPDERVAAQLLGLSYEQAQKLFYTPYGLGMSSVTNAEAVMVLDDMLARNQPNARWGLVTTARKKAARA